MKEKRIASDKLMTFIINVLCESPSGQISEDVKNSFIKLNSEDHTQSEIYDFIVGVSKLPITEVSKFTVSMCELDKYYLLLGRQELYQLSY